MNNLKIVNQKRKNHSTKEWRKDYDYTRIVAMKEKVEGNESVGTMWTETKVFTKYTRINNIIEWAADCDGKLTITIDESSIMSNKDQKEDTNEPEK